MDEVSTMSMQGRAETLAELPLPKHARRILGALAPIVLSEDVLERDLLEPLLGELELFLAAAPTPVRMGLLTGLIGFDQGARVLRGGRLKGFAGLDRERATAYYQSWWESRLLPMNQLARGLKMIMSFCYYELPQVQDDLGYDPARWIAKVKKQRLKKFGDEISAFEAAVNDPDPLPSTRADADSAS